MRKSNSIHPLTSICKEVENYVCSEIIQVQLPWEHSSLSATYRLFTKNNDVFYVKGHPREKNEAELTQYLHGIFPEIVPKVLAADILKNSNWQWFLMEDSGLSSHDDIDLKVVEQAVYNLAILQKKVMNDQTLPNILVHCTPLDLDHIVRNCCDWAKQFDLSSEEKQLVEIVQSISQNKVQSLKKMLSEIPPTCVHSDFWSGNLSLCDRRVKLIDWGEALWGVGGVSIVNIILAEDLFDDEDQIWKVYENGLEIRITDEYKLGCKIAYIISNLLLEQNISSSMESKFGPGFVTMMQHLSNEIMNF